MSKDFQIKIEVTAETKEDAAMWLEQKCADLRATDYPEQSIGGGGGGDQWPNYFVYIGQRHLTDQERIRRLEQALLKS
jgi:hypothetical protein